ncbi:MAG: hypothetical protein ACREDP_20230, partial [Bradyrhizobium sp.]
LWQDPTGLFTTVFLGIDPVTGCWVSADPVLHNPTRMYISLEFKRQDLEIARETGWHVWERESSRKKDEPVEVLIGGRPERLFDLVRFERAAVGLDQGNRHLLAAEHLKDVREPPKLEAVPTLSMEMPLERLHEIAREFEMSSDEILSLIGTAPRLKMAVRGWVAETHLQRTLATIPGVTDCERLNLEGQPDISLRYKGRGPILVECKNVLRQPTADGIPRVDFQRTRASQGDRCSRYYRPTEFNVLAACLHAITERWEFAYRLPKTMAAHKNCPGRLSNLVRVDGSWGDAAHVLEAAAGDIS